MADGDAGSPAQAPPVPRVLLCASADLPDAGKAYVFEVLQYRRPEHAFALRFEGRVVAYLNRCAHVPTRMDWQEGEFLDLTKSWIICSIHGAMYDPRTGRCAGGPCNRGRLVPLDVREEGGYVYWYPDRDVQPVQGADNSNISPNSTSSS